MTTTTPTSGAADLRTTFREILVDLPNTAPFTIFKAGFDAALATGQATAAQAVVHPEPVGWYSKQYGFVYMHLQPHQFQVGSTLYLKDGTPAWRIESTCSKRALIDMKDLPHGTVFYDAAPAQPAPRPVTAEEHDALMAAARDSMKLVAKGRLVEPAPGVESNTAGSEPSDDDLISIVAPLIYHNGWYWCAKDGDLQAALRAVVLRASHGQAPAQPIEVCMSTPPGWRCTRKAGHEGPCAAVRCPEELEFVARGMARLKAAEAGPQATPSPQAAQQALAPTVTFEDPRVQIVYQTIIDDSDWPPKDGPQHWDGWISRRIVDRLFAPVEPQAPAGAQVDSQTTPELPPLPDPDLRDVGIRPQDIKDFLKGYATEYARAALATCSQADSVQEDAFSILEAVSRCFTTDDALPDNLLPRIDALIAARAAQKEGL